MGQKNSKEERKGNELEEEEEKKILDQIQKNKEKNEQRKKENDQSTCENRTHEMKLCRADQETTTNNIPEKSEKTYPSSASSVECEHLLSLVDQDKVYNDCDEHVHKYTATFEGNDPVDCVNVHNPLLNQTLRIVTAAIVEPLIGTIHTQKDHAVCPKEEQNRHSKKENVNSVFAKKDKSKSNQEKALSNACSIPSTDTNEKDIKEDIELEMREGDGLSKYENEIGLRGQAISTAEKMKNITKDEETHANSKAAKISLKINNRLGSAKKDFSYQLYDKSFSESAISLDDLNLPNVFCKVSVEDVDYLRVLAFWYPINRPRYEHIYAVGFRSEPVLQRSVGDRAIIKHILQTAHLREFYLDDEHFRLATFSLSAANYRMGDMLTLSAWGYFFDIDGRIKCFSCDGTYRNGHCNDHSQNCVGRYSERNVGISIADNYGAFASGRLVPSGQNIQEGYRSIDVHIRLTTTSIRLGRTQLYALYETEETDSQDHEEGDNAEEISVRDSRINSRTDLPLEENLDVPSSEACAGGAEHTTLPTSNQILTQRQEAFPSDYQDNPLNGNQTKGRASKECKESVQRCNLLMVENEHMRSRTRCRICKNRRCNIVLLPCRHFVICDNCVINTTVCPVCKRKVVKAFRCE